MIQFNKKLRGWLLLGVIALLSAFGLSSSMVPGSTGGCAGGKNPRFQEKGIANHQKAFCLYRII